MTILETINEARNGNYCHATEVNGVCEMESIIEAVISEYSERSEADILEFFNTISVYALNDENEQAIYDFSFNDYIKGTI